MVPGCRALLVTTSRACTWGEVREGAAALDHQGPVQQYYICSPPHFRQVARRRQLSDADSAGMCQRPRLRMAVAMALSTIAALDCSEQEPRSLQGTVVRYPETPKMCGNTERRIAISGILIQMHSTAEQRSSPAWFLSRIQQSNIERRNIVLQPA